MTLVGRLVNGYYKVPARFREQLSSILGLPSMSRCSSTTMTHAKYAYVAKVDCDLTVRPNVCRANSSFTTVKSRR